MLREMLCKGKKNDRRYSGLFVLESLEYEEVAPKVDLDRLLSN